MPRIERVRIFLVRLPAIVGRAAMTMCSGLGVLLAALPRAWGVVRKCNTRLCRLGRLVLAFLLWLFIIHADFFGISDATNRLSQDIVLRALAPFYPYDEKPISIVLIDDDTLTQLQHDYIIEYNDWVDLLNAVSCAGPEAIFIDLIFFRPHDGAERLPQDLLDLLAKERPSDADEAAPQPPGCSIRSPIFIADLGNRDSALGFSVVGNERELRAKSLTTPVNWTFDERTYPLWMTVHDKGGNSRPVPRSKPGAWAGRCGNFVPYPALLLYLHSRGKLVEPAESCVPGLLTTPALDDGWPPLRVGDEEMLIYWGYYPARRPHGFETLVSEFYCDPLLKSEISIAKKAIEASSQVAMDVAHKFWISQRESRQPCLYFPSISAWKVIADAGAMPEYSTGPRYSPLRRLFQGRYVFIGSNITGAHDLVVSPVHGQVPGVFLHAMALDNLLRYDSHVWRPAPVAVDRAWLRLSWDTIVEAIVVLIGLALNRLNMGRLRALSATFVLIAVISVILGGVFLWSPINWAGTILAIIVDSFINPVREKAEESVLTFGDSKTSREEET